MPKEMEEQQEAWEPRTREFAALRSFLEREHLARQEGRQALYDRPVCERVASGTAIDGLIFQGTFRDQNKELLVFVSARNDSRLRPGSRVRLSRGDARRPAARLELVDDRYDGKKYVLRLAGGPEKTDAFETAEPWVLDEDVFDLLDLQIDMLRAAEAAGHGAWLDGSEASPLAPEHGEPDSPLAEGLEASIGSAFSLSLSAEPYFAVQGPPGSGKTHLLARLALHYALVEDKRVLITAVSHQAIHHALAETYWVGQRVAEKDSMARDLLNAGFYKIGASRGNNEGLPEGVHARMRAPARLRPLIAGGTVYSAWLGRSSDKLGYDVVLFDEAGQAPLILALGARVLAPKTVFIGDDAQLPPVVEAPPEEEVDWIARVSALEFIRKTYGDPPLLTESRRLNRELCAVVSDCFYGGALSPSKEAAGRRLSLKSAPSTPFARILDPERSLVFVDAGHRDCRSVSEPEALWAAAIASEAVRCGLAPEEIGIIAPYRAQCNRIRFLLEGDGRSACSTVERFQGQEREMVIISLTSSSPRYLARLAGFLFSPNRLNVAISRARTKVVILGSRSALKEAAEAVDPDAEGARGLSIFLKILNASAQVEVASCPPAPSPDRPEKGEGKAALKSKDGGKYAFEPGRAVEHPKYGAGMVLTKSVQLIDNRREWVNEIRFNDGQVRLVVARLTHPPMREIG